MNGKVRVQTHTHTHTYIYIYIYIYYVCVYVCVCVRTFPFICKYCKDMILNIYEITLNKIMGLNKVVFNIFRIGYTLFVILAVPK